MLLAHCSYFDHLGMLIETAGYTGSEVFVLKVVYGFLFYTQHIHNDEEGLNSLCLSYFMPLIFPSASYSKRKNC